MRPAQIRAMFRAFAALVRSFYLLAVLSSAAFGGWLLLQSLRVVIRPRAAELQYASALPMLCLLLAGFLPSLRAIARLLKRTDLVPDERLRERPVVATTVALTAALGVLLLYFVLRIWLDIQPWGAEAGPTMMVAGAALLLITIAMLTGELVLVGRAPARLS
jgi:hypothetical protein